MSETAAPREVGELLQAWVGVKLDEVDGLVDEARRKTAAIPDRGSIAVLLGELYMRVAVLEQEVAQLRKAAER